MMDIKEVIPEFQKLKQDRELYSVSPEEWRQSGHYLSCESQS